MKLHYREFGQGTPLMILHGLFGSADNWNTLAKKFAEQFHVITVDQRNHGQSPHDDVFHYTAMVEDLKELMDDLGLEKAFLLGHSLGGKTVMNFAALYPERVEKLLVADIAPKYYEVHHQDIIKALYGLDLDHIQSRKEAEEAFATLLEEEGTRQFLLKSLYWKDGKLAWRFHLDAIASQIEIVGKALDETAIYSGPTLFIRGGSSRYIKDEDLEGIMEHFPLAILTTIPGAGHWLHAEKPLEFYQVVMDFLQS